MDEPINSKIFLRRYYSTYHFIPETITFFLKQRIVEKDNISIISGLNFSIVTGLTALIETLNREVLNDKANSNRQLIIAKSLGLKKKETVLSSIIDEKNIPELNEYEKLYLRIDKSGWKQQKPLYNEIFKNQLVDIVDTELLIDIDMLFTYRNIIAHGNELTIDESNCNEIITRNLEIVFNYLQTKDRFSKLDKEDFSLINTLMSNQVIDHFLDVAQRYITAFAIEYFYANGNKKVNMKFWEIPIKDNNK